MDVDLEARRIVVVADALPAEPIPTGRELHVLDKSTSPPDYLGALRVVEVGEDTDRAGTGGGHGPRGAGQTGCELWSLVAWRTSAGGVACALLRRSLEAKEKLPAELLLLVDPLVSISTAIAARTWVWSLVFAAAILLVCVVIPRGFCGYVCPLGTLIDLFDWLVGRRVILLRGPVTGGWRKLKYYVLVSVLMCSVCGVLISGFVAAIPVLTRGLAFLLAPLQTAAFRGWYQVPPVGGATRCRSMLFALVLLLGLRAALDSGAATSVRLAPSSQRRTCSDCSSAGRSTCTGCDRCRRICPFDAIHDDYTTRVADCTLCRTCGGRARSGRSTICRAGIRRTRSAVSPRVVPTS